VRYRRPYVARHSSVSWNLMLGKNVLWVAKQHGHSIMTMLRTYAAWTEGAVEADVQTIERSMMLTTSRAPSDPPLDGGRSSKDGTQDDLAVVQPVQTTIKGPQGMSYAVNDTKVRPPTPCSIMKNRLRRMWLGWKDSNLRMAGSKPAIIQHDQQVTELAG
jgi:hypothetical protein